MADAKFEVEIGQNSVTVAGETLVFEAPISDAIEVDGQLLVLLTIGTVPENHPMFERNVISVAGDGTLMWRIEPSARARKEIDGVRIHNEYVGIDLQENETKLVAYDMQGLCFEVDPETGNISNPVFTR